MDKIQKFLKQLNKKDRAVLLNILSDIRTLKIKPYDVKALQDYKN